jgi:hypothetical protein
VVLVAVVSKILKSGQTVETAEAVPQQPPQE